MHATLTDEQEQMRDAARDFFENQDVLETARQQLDGEDVIDDLWADLARMDYPAVTVPTEFGGLGEDTLYTTLLLEEAGRVAMPGPFAETALFATPLIDELGTDDQRTDYLPAIADGETTVSFALYEGGVEPIPAAIQLEARPTDEGVRLSGTKTLVPYAEAVDHVIVATRTMDGRRSDGITLFLVDPDDASIEPADTLDKTRPFYSLTFDDVIVPAEAQLGPRHGGGSALQLAVDRYTTGICGMMTGAMERVVELSVEQGKNREQFGHPIGRFQAVKHRIVDMWMDMQAGRSLVYYAAWALANDDPDAGRAVSAAKSFCGDTYTRICGDDMQNQGAMGFTWDHDTHIYLKQATALRNFLGSPQEHRERIADARGI